jgi:hypothetical protein
MTAAGDDIGAKVGAGASPAVIGILHGISVLNGSRCDRRGNGAPRHLDAKNHAYDKIYPETKINKY